jgi:hypothetical protein
MKTIRMISYFMGVLLVLPLGLSSQSLTPQVISNAGGTFSNSGIKMSWTLGETAVAHITTSGGAITEGFHQPSLQVIAPGSSDAIAIKIAPNPVQSTLNVQIPASNQSEWVATLTDASGRVLLRKTRLQTGNTELDLSNYPEGVYFLGLQDSGNRAQQTFKVVKTQ